MLSGYLTHPKFSLMIWGYITYNGVGTITIVDGNMNAQKYIETLEDYLWPIIVCHFPNENYIYQDDNAPIYRTRVVSNYTRYAPKVRGLVALPR